MNWKNNFVKKNRYFETENGILYKGDCLEVIKEFPNNIIDCVITSPPYNVDLGNNKYKKEGYNLYRDNKEHEDYINWLANIFDIIYEKLIIGGRLCINIGDGKNGKIPTHSDLIQILKQKYLISSTIIWNKKQIGNNCAWGSFNSPSNVSYPTPFEYILLFAKDTYQLQKKQKSDLVKSEFIKYARALWDFNPETDMKKYNHPAVFPIELPQRCIKMNTYINDIVLDCFMGSGTTAVACERLNRRWVGIEISEEYCEIARKRILKEIEQRYLL